MERVFTATATLKLQGRDVLAFLTETLAAHSRGLRSYPLRPYLSSLLPPELVNGYDIRAACSAARR